MTRTKLYLSFTLLTLLLLLNFVKEQQPNQIVKNLKRSKADRIETDKYIDAGDIYFQN
jgi:hypothetical protein